MDPLTFYFDRTFGKRLPSLLNRVRGTPFLVRHHHGEFFKQEMPDDEWLEIAGKNKWIVLTQDYKFHLPQFEVELAAVRAHSVRCFYFPGASETTWEALRVFVSFHKKLLKQTETSGPCFIQELQKSGRIRVVYNEGR